MNFHTRGLMAIFRNQFHQQMMGQQPTAFSPNNEGMPFCYDIKNPWE
jgi:hypothetical protein